jgi:hypothetical protein
MVSAFTSFEYEMKQQMDHQETSIAFVTSAITSFEYEMKQQMVTKRHQQPLYGQ